MINPQNITEPKTIKFSHRYQKLGVLGNRIDEKYTAQLINVTNIRLEDLTPEFLAYDTDHGRYELPKRGEYLLLLFLAVGGLFTTLRRKTPEKERYYRSLIGSTLSIQFI